MSLANHLARAARRGTHGLLRGRSSYGDGQPRLAAGRDSAPPVTATHKENQGRRLDSAALVMLD